MKISECNGIRSLSSILEESGVSQSNSMNFKDWFVSSFVDSVYGCPTFCSSGCSFLWKPSLTNPQTFAIWKDSELLRKLDFFLSTTIMIFRFVAGTSVVWLLLWNNCC